MKVAGRPASANLRPPRGPRARELLNISGAEFLRRWDAGEYRPVPDDAESRKVGELVMMPFARRTEF